MGAIEPVVSEGTLRQIPLAHLLGDARRTRRTAKLVLEHAEERATLDLARGRLRRVTTKPRVAFFGAVVYDLGWVVLSALEETRNESAETGRLHGDVLVARGWLSPAQRDRALAEQMCQKVHHLFAWPGETSFHFDDAPRLTASEPQGVELDPLAAAWRGVRDYPPVYRVREVLASWADAVLKVDPSSVDLSAELGFSKDEMDLLAVLARTPETLDELRRRGTVPRSRVDLLVYLLAITGCLTRVSGDVSSPERFAGAPAPLRAG